MVGNVLLDTQPKLFVPQGFAGGMTDPFMGLIKFGYRYYDPKVGRFVTLDPAKDMRGDGDLYDYCADDPVNRVDMDGLAFAAIYPAAVGAAHLVSVYGPTVARYGRQAWNAFGTTAGMHADKIKAATDAVEGFFIDGPPPNSRAGYAGVIGGKAKKWAENNLTISEITKRAYKELHDTGGID